MKLFLRCLRASCLVSALLLAGCATMKVDWPARVGSFTFDQAVVELGPPDKTAKLTDGVRVAEWLTQHGFPHGFVHTTAGGLFTSVDMMPPRDTFLRLTFGADGVLREWKRVWR